MENFVYKYFRKLPHFVIILNSRKYCLIDFNQKDVEISD